MTAESSVSEVTQKIHKCVSNFLLVTDNPLDHLVFTVHILHMEVDILPPAWKQAATAKQLDLSHLLKHDPEAHFPLFPPQNRDACCYFRLLICLRLEFNMTLAPMS